MTSDDAAHLPRPTEWHPIGILDLEPDAWSALTDPASTAVTAGPGSGKTEFLGQRAAYLLQTGACPPPRRILAISYKRSSAATLAERVATRVPEHAHRFVAMTFDAFTKGIVDQFGRALPATWALRNRRYEVKPIWPAQEIGEFLYELARGLPTSHAHQVRSLRADRFLPDIIGTWPLPESLDSKPVGVQAFTARAWWNKHYLGPTVPLVNFTMLNRLAELLVRTNPRIHRALRATYPFVFVDEFQDTTSAQITFLKTVFGHDGIVTTAVGDGKQRIMAFAGALDDAMSRYESDFGARKYQLTWNFRSSAELVEFQHGVAVRLEPSTSPGVSQIATQVGHAAVSIWVYPNRASQAEQLADWIAKDIASSERTARDFAIVARQKVELVEAELSAALERRSIKLRNDDARCGALRLQELATNDVVQLVLGTLRLATDTRGLASVWARTVDLVGRAQARSADERSSRHVADHVSNCISELRTWLRANTIASVTPAEVVRRAALVVEPTELAALAHARRSGDEATLYLEALADRIAQVLPAAGSWAEAFSNITPDDAVTLMTIHRSKGLEFHTVTVLDLDDGQWWAYPRRPNEELAAFFVGLSRAAHRLIFTRVDRAPYEKVRDFYAYLATCGARETRWDGGALGL